MGSKKRSAKAQQRASFEASLFNGSQSLESAFAREDAHTERIQAEHEQRLRYKACERKKRYPNEQEAEVAKQACKNHGARDLNIYQCPYCKGYHLTHKPKK